MDNKEKDIGALWERSSPKGEFLTGIVTIENVAYQIVCFKNGYKDKPNQPDWRIYKSTPREDRERVQDVQIDDTPSSEVPF